MRQRAGRFAFDDPWWDPEALFRPFMEELRLRYDDYAMVRDRLAGKWLIYRKMGSMQNKAVVYIENGDGTAAEPSMEVIDRLSKSDVFRNFGGPKEYLDWLQREEERVQGEKMQSLLDDIDYYAAKPIRDYIDGGGRESIMLRPLSETHRKQLDGDLNASAATA